MTKKIVLIGCGNVGSRHLQALAKLSCATEIHIVEPDKKAQKIAIQRLDEIQNNKSHNYHWYDTIQELKVKSDLVIVATLSTGRVKLITRLLELDHSRFLIEKVVCQSKEEYEELLSKISKFNAKGWVNTTPRCFESYRVIKENFTESDMIYFSVIASNISSLGTNAIHYLDLFSWLVGDPKIKLNGEYLLDKLFENKRGKNFKEFGGTIIGSVKNGSRSVLTFIPDTTLSTIVTISGNNKHFIIDETNEKILVLDRDTKSKMKFKYEHISSLTTSIVDDILNKDDCLLPTLQYSFYMHCELFRIFNAQIKKISKRSVKLCPIT